MFFFIHFRLLIHFILFSLFIYIHSFYSFILFYSAYLFIFIHLLFLGLFHYGFNSPVVQDHQAYSVLVNKLVFCAWLRVALYKFRDYDFNSGLIVAKTSRRK